MLQSNRADIGMFETLQADQHAKTGVSQMAVFNKVADCNGDVKEALDAIKEMEKLAYKIGRAENSGRTDPSVLREMNRQHQHVRGRASSLAYIAKRRLEAEKNKILDALKADPSDKEAQKEKREFNNIAKKLDKAGWFESASAIS
jgi:hypothetical protein